MNAVKDVNTLIDSKLIFLESLVRDMQLGWCEDYYQKNYLS